MDKKFIKENKRVLREFIGSAIAALITGKMSADLKKKIKDDPEINKKKKELAKITSDLAKRLERTKKTNPELYNLLKKSL
tara:strand:+ start:45 stop:284 length:240 start_codon:yes stop_codon:yes gene_type:complete